VKGILLLAILCLCCKNEAAANQQLDALLNARHDQILERTVVPAVEKPQGEVRLIRRGPLLVVQTLLASRVLKRVVGVIDTKEQNRWPEGSDGYFDSTRYRNELFLATNKSWSLFRQREAKDELRQFLLIEFILGADQSAIALSVPQVAGMYGQMQLIGQKTLSVWQSPGNYVKENIREIIRDNFNFDVAAQEKLLKPFSPEGY